MKAKWHKLPLFFSKEKAAIFFLLNMFKIDRRFLQVKDFFKENEGYIIVIEYRNFTSDADMMELIKKETKNAITYGCNF